jgi:sugar phosphate isomerase/epimerase
MARNRFGVNSFAAFLVEISRHPHANLGEIEFSSITEAIRFAKQNDFDYVEAALDFPLLGDADLRERLSDFIRDEGLPVNVHAPFVDLTLSSHDLNVREASIKSVSLAIAFGKEIKAGAVTFHPGARHEPISHVGDYYFDVLISALQKIMGMHPSPSPRLCLENMPADHRLFGTIEEIKRVLAQPGLDALWLTYDSSHLFTTEQDPDAFWAELHARIGNIHLVDNRYYDNDPHLPLGQGKVDFKSIARLITRYQYPHDILIELHSLYHGKRGRAYFQNLLNDITAGN